MAGDSFTKEKLDWLDKIAANPDVGAPAFRVAYLIAGYLNRESGLAWPGENTLAKRLGVTGRAVRRAIAELKQRGHLSVRRGGPGQTSRFQMITTDRTNSSGPDRTIPSGQQTAQSGRFRPPDRTNSSAKTGRILPTEHYEEHIEEHIERDARGKRRRNASPKRASSMPEIWPTESDLEWAQTYWHGKGRSDLTSRINDIAARGRNHHAAKGTLSKDWAATWRTWAMREPEYSKPAGQPTHATGGMSAARGIFAAMGDD